MNDEDLIRFCAANDIARVEREVNGEILVMSPAGNRTGRRNAAIIGALDTWSQKDGRGYVFDSSTGFSLPDGSMRSPMPHGLRTDVGTLSVKQTRTVFRRFAPTS
jgi:Uma2 family endonuclease